MLVRGRDLLLFDLRTCNQECETLVQRDHAVDKQEDFMKPSCVSRLRTIFEPELRFAYEECPLCQAEIIDLEDVSYRTAYLRCLKEISRRGRVLIPRI